MTYIEVNCQFFTISLISHVQTEVNEDTQQPLDKLSPVALEWCRSHGSSAQTVSDVQNDPTLLETIQSAINNVNNSATSHAQYIQKWSILHRDFSVQGGELGEFNNLIINNATIVS
jgi:long-subunit acyl-CoA synthetase (AMP-forming)